MRCWRSSPRITAPTGQLLTALSLLEITIKRRGLASEGITDVRLVTAREGGTMISPMFAGDGGVGKENVRAKKKLMDRNRHEKPMPRDCTLSVEGRLLLYVW